ncbi:MAG: STAS domain-containing protein [Parachlamydiales bacterium]|nr:STAS domain-containing protein [Parachlamydiales bacterium]
MALGLNVNIEEIDKRIILRLEGRLDAPSSSVLESKLNALIKEKHKNVFLDFSDLDYLSSAGLRLLLSYTKKFLEHDFKLGIFSINEDVMKVIKLTGFEHILNIFKNEKDALGEKLK